MKVNDANPDDLELIPWSVKENERFRDERKLKKYNTIACILHLIQAIALLILGLQVEKASNFKLPLTTVFLKWPNGYPVQNLKREGLIPFTAVTSGFSWLSALFHFLVLIFFETYIKDLRKGINRFRWYEYALSSSLMIALIAMLFGMYDIISLILLMSVNACMNLFGLMMEVLNQNKKNKDWTPFYFGCFAGVVPWAVIFAYLGGVDGLDGMPGFVWGIIVSYFVMFQTFPINMILQYKAVNRWNDQYWGYRMSGYYYGEIVYQVLSLFAKSLLVWLVFGGTNQPNKGYN